MGKNKHDDDNNDAIGADIAHPLERIARLTRASEHDGNLNPAQRETLRYLARANRFSNSPGALTRYLGATKGTVSQTVMALERKGHVMKAQRPGEKRSVALTLTPKGKDVLEADPWVRLAEAADGLGGKTRRRLAKGLSELLAIELTRGSLPPFGTCSGCRFFREKGRDADPDGPHLCMLLEQPLSAADARLICAFHEAA